MWAAYSYVKCTGKITKPFHGPLLFFFSWILLGLFEIKTAVCWFWYYFHQVSLLTCTMRNCMENSVQITFAFCTTEKTCLDYCLNHKSTMSTETMEVSLVLCFHSIYLHWCMWLHIYNGILITQVKFMLWYWNKDICSSRISGFATTNSKLFLWSRTILPGKTKKQQ